MSAPNRGGRPVFSSLAVVYATVFLDLLGFGIILPALPYFARELGASGLLLGVLISSYSVAQLLGAAILGRISDRLNRRRPVLLLSLAGAALAMLLTALAGSLVMLCLARAVAGLFGGSIATAQAYVADVTRPAERARYMGLLGASIGLGFVFGPALGAAFIGLGLGFSGAAFTAAGLIAANLLFATFKLHESRPVGKAASLERPSLGRWGEALARPGLARLFAATFLTMFAFVSMETTFAYVGQDRFGIGGQTFGLILVYVGVVAIAVQGGLIGRLTHRFGVRRVAVVGGLLMAVSLALVPLCPGLPSTLVVLGLLAASQGLTAPTLPTLVSQAAGSQEQGSVLGFSQSLGAAARAVGPLLAGALYDLHLALPYLAGGALALLAALLVVGLPEVGEPPGTEASPGELLS